MTIAAASDDDLAAILDWLKDEYDQQGTGEGFWCNRRILQNDHSAGELLVLREHGEAVAFQTGRLLTPGILEVRPDMRGRGFGRQLVDYCIAEARANDKCFLHIECTPESSIPFWKRMGFTLFGEGPYSHYSYPHAFMVLDRHLGFVSGIGAEASVIVQFYRDGAYADPTALPVSEYTPRAYRMHDGRIALESRVVGFHPLDPNDLVVRMVVDGEEVFFNRAKYGQERGVQDRRPVFCIDMITPLGNH